VNIDVVVGSAVVGLLVGMTGSGGGALMTPMLILLFSVKPSAAISSDLVAAVVMRPVGSAVHLGRGTVDLRLVAWMAAGSVPAALAGSYVLRLLGHTEAATGHVETALGAALVLAAGGMVLRYVLDGRVGRQRRGVVEHSPVRPVLNLAVGALGGFVVGTTSVGAGSLMIVLLMFVYPTLGANQLVGTDLVQAMPLTAAAALGAFAFGHVQLPLTSAMVVGSVPAVFLGSVLSSQVPDRFLRPVIMVVVLASGLECLGVGSADLGWSLLLVLVVIGGQWLVRARPRRRPTFEPRPGLGVPDGSG
jgi:uncharacterized membrane protein YfcA